MDTVFFYFMLAFLLPRVVYQWRDERRAGEGKALVWAALFEAVFLLPLMGASSFFLLFAFICAYHLFGYGMGRVIANVYLERIVEFVFLLIGGGFFAGVFSRRLVFNREQLRVLGDFIHYHVLLDRYSAADMGTVLIVLFGVVVLVNEMNSVVRFILNAIRTEPMLNADTPDERELGRGKIIGIIERLLFFFFVLTDNFASIAFILAAKGFTRFRMLDDKNFAEYMLIGTLLSSAISIFWAYYIRFLIG